jgi:hypothetical protein
MSFAPKILPIASILMLMFSNGCSNKPSNQKNVNIVSSNTNSEIKNEKSLAKDDIEELELTIKMPFHPEEALWREEPLGNQTNNNRLPAPNEKTLTAVLKFNPEEANKIVETAEKIKPAQPIEIEPERWFPPELIAQSQQSGNETIKGKTYAADEFFQSPYLQGKLTRIEGTNFFVLELFAL